MGSNWCTKCLSLSQKVVCEMCLQAACQYCSEQASWLVHSEDVISVIKLHITDDINDFQLGLEDQLYFVCSDNCLDNLITYIEYNDDSSIIDSLESENSSFLISDEDLLFSEICDEF